MKDVRIHLAGFILILFYSCSSEKRETMTKPIPTTKNASSDAKIHPGKMVYLQFCLACHMQNGEGVPGLYPPLIRTEYVLGDRNRLIKAILYGQEGLIEVNGEQYNNVMAKMDYLRDEQIADLLTYVRSSFGNSTDSITIDDVKIARSEGAN